MICTGHSGLSLIHKDSPIALAHTYVEVVGRGLHVLERADSRHAAAHGASVNEACLHKVCRANHVCP